MSQQEFDTYLALLCRLLRIAPQQREQVAEEFRTHMEDRLDELFAKGMDREAAVKLALEEFGDAAGLAAQIASISQGRRKRWIMRIGTVSVVGLAAAGLLAVALWPEGVQVKAPQVVAQPGEKPSEKPAEPEEKPAKVERGEVDRGKAGAANRCRLSPRAPQGSARATSRTARECKCMSTARGCLPNLKFSTHRSRSTSNKCGWTWSSIWCSNKRARGSWPMSSEMASSSSQAPKRFPARAKSRSTTAATCWRWLRRCREVE